MISARLTLVTIGVSDVARATAFYTSLGWQPATASTDGVTFLQLSGVVLSLLGWADLAEDAHVDSAGSGFRGVSLAINLESREDVDAAYAEWLAVGGTAVRAPEAAFWGGYTSYVADPDGHLWEIAHNPYFVMTPDGRLDLTQ